MKEIHKPRMSASMAMVTDANGNPSTSTTITNSELNALNGWVNDGKGYIYPRLTSLESTTPLKANYPNWSSKTLILTSAGSTYTAPSDGYLAIVCDSTQKKFTGTIGGFAIKIGSQVTDYHKFMSAVFPVRKGTVIACTELGNSGSGSTIHCAYFLTSQT